MSLADIIKVLQPSLNVLAGGIVAILSSLIQNRFAANREKTKIHLEKLERTYSMCQKVYDGHLREINNAKRYWKSAASTRDYLDHRKHPGTEMSELKMLVRCYFPKLLEQLADLNNGHTKLKEIFIKLDDAAQSAEARSKFHFDEALVEAEKSLEILGNAANELKRLLAATAVKST